MSTPLQEVLIKLYHEHRPSLTAYPWEWEEDRWAELIKCSTVAMGLSPNAAAVLVEVLSRLQLASVSDLADADDATLQLISAIVTRIGGDPAITANVANALRSLARGIRSEWDGHIQRFLRRHNLAMIEELASHLHGFGLERPTAVRAATLWLQNVSNAPVLMDDERVRKFRERFNVSKEDLIEEADKLGVNLAVLEDLLVTEDAAASEGAALSTGA